MAHNRKASAVNYGSLFKFLFTDVLLSFQSGYSKLYQSKILFEVRCCSTTDGVSDLPNIIVILADFIEGVAYSRLLGSILYSFDVDIPAKPVSAFSPVLRTPFIEAAVGSCLHRLRSGVESSQNLKSPVSNAVVVRPHRFFVTDNCHFKRSVAGWIALLISFDPHH